MNSYYPLFSHLLENPAAHPEELYSAMISLGGSLTTFSPNVRPSDLPLYVHDALGPVFTELNEKLRAMLETVVPTNLVSLPLKLTKTSIYATALDNEKYFQGAKLYLAVGADNPKDVLIRDVPMKLKVCRQAMSGYSLNGLCRGFHSRIHRGRRTRSP